MRKGFKKVLVGAAVAFVGMMAYILLKTPEEKQKDFDVNDDMEVVAEAKKADATESVVEEKAMDDTEIVAEEKVTNATEVVAADDMKQGAAEKE